jgi:4-amino-4-deoxy-L-arabinose transferase-like glycosyltransferase
VQHVLDALAFRCFGPGVAQARWVSVIAGVSIVWSVGWLALRWYGLPAALTAELLLTIWRSDLTAGATGLPLLDVARVARYDVLAVACVWLALVALERFPKRPLLAGVCAGLAVLSQFFGVFVLPVLLLAGGRRLGGVSPELPSSPLRGLRSSPSTPTTWRANLACTAPAASFCDTRSTSTMSSPNPRGMPTC